MLVSVYYRIVAIYHFPIFCVFSRLVILNLNGCSAKTYQVSLANSPFLQLTFIHFSQFSKYIFSITNVLPFNITKKTKSFINRKPLHFSL